MKLLNSFWIQFKQYDGYFSYSSNSAFSFLWMQLCIKSVCGTPMNSSLRSQSFKFKGGEYFSELRQTDLLNFAPFNDCSIFYGPKRGSWRGGGGTGVVETHVERCQRALLNAHVKAVYLSKFMRFFN